MARRELGRKIRVLIVDDQPILRRGLQALIDQQPDMIVCGESQGASDAMARLAELEPDLASVDLNLGPDSGFDLIRQMRMQQGSALKILVVSLEDDSRLIERAKAAGANGYLTKSEAPHRLTATIREMAAGSAASRTLRHDGARFCKQT